MRRFTLVLVALSGCVGVPVAAGGADRSVREPVEVAGHVTRSCPTPTPQALESVTLRAAGELDALDTTQTDSNGAFRFHLIPSGDLTAPLLIEVRGVKAMAKLQPNSKSSLVAELSLPCTGG